MLFYVNFYLFISNTMTPLLLSRGKITNLISKITKISVYLTFNLLFVLFFNMKVHIKSV